jgi:hypothetical protein
MAAHMAAAEPYVDAAFACMPDLAVGFMDVEYARALAHMPATSSRQRPELIRDLVTSAASQAHRIRALQHGAARNPATEQETAERRSIMEKALERARKMCDVRS